MDAAKKHKMAAAYRTLMSVVYNSVPQRDVHKAFRKRSANSDATCRRMEEWLGAIVALATYGPVERRQLKAVISILIKRQV